MFWLKIRLNHAHLERQILIGIVHFVLNLICSGFYLDIVSTLFRCGLGFEFEQSYSLI